MERSDPGRGGCTAIQETRLRWVMWLLAAMVIAPAPLEMRHWLVGGACACLSLVEAWFPTESTLLRFQQSGIVLEHARPLFFVFTFVYGFVGLEAMVWVLSLILAL